MAMLAFRPCDPGSPGAIADRRRPKRTGCRGPIGERISAFDGSEFVGLFASRGEKQVSPNPSRNPSSCRLVVKSQAPWDLFFGILLIPPAQNCTSGVIGALAPMRNHSCCAGEAVSRLSQKPRELDSVLKNERMELIQNGFTKWNCQSPSVPLSTATLPGDPKLT
jgi:hypothetical protein